MTTSSRPPSPPNIGTITWRIFAASSTNAQLPASRTSSFTNKNWRWKLWQDSKTLSGIFVHKTTEKMHFVCPFLCSKSVCHKSLENRKKWSALEDQDGFPCLPPKKARAFLLLLGEGTPNSQTIIRHHRACRVFSMKLCSPQIFGQSQVVSTHLLEHTPLGGSSQLVGLWDPFQIT